MWQESQVLLRGEAGSGGCGGCGDSRFPVWLPMSLVARCVPGAINNWSAVPGSAAGSVCETMLDAWVGRVGWMGLSVESVLSSLLRLFLSFFFLSFLLHMRRSYVFICLSTGTVAMRSRPRGVCRVDVRAMVLCFCLLDHTPSTIARIMRECIHVTWCEVYSSCCRLVRVATFCCIFLNIDRRNVRCFCPIVCVWWWWLRCACVCCSCFSCLFHGIFHRCVRFVLLCRVTRVHGRFQVLSFLLLL